MVGSVGVVLTHLDRSGELEKKGVKFHEFKDLAKMREAMKPIVDEWAAKDPAIAKFVATAQKIEELGNGFE